MRSASRSLATSIIACAGAVDRNTKSVLDAHLAQISRNLAELKVERDGRMRIAGPASMHKDEMTSPITRNLLRKRERTR